MEITGQPSINLGGGGSGIFGGDGGIVLLAFLAMLGGFGGGFGGRGPMPMTGDQAPVSSAQFQTGMNMQNLENQNRDINNNVYGVYHDLASNFADKYSELKDDTAALAVTLANMQANQNTCCGEIKQQIAGLNLDNERRFNALESKMDQSEIRQLRDRLEQQARDMQELRADMRMQGVVRFPQGYAYNAGPGPFGGAPLPPAPLGVGF